MANNPVASLQCIDLSNPDMHQSAALIKQACIDCGIFYVKNHGISEEFMSEVFKEIKKFFGLPHNEKKKLSYNEYLRGYQQSFGATPLEDDPTFFRPTLLEDDPTYDWPPVEYSEAFTVGATLLEDDPTFVWPPADVLPRWKETMQKYHRQVLNVGRAIMKIIALALEINVDFFDQPSWLGGTTSNFSSILHYGVSETEPSKIRLGNIPHTDSTLLTLLATEGVKGLQICKDNDTKPQVWENVLPLKGAFIVNVGDMLERLSNCTFRSVLHKVVYSEERYSTTVFISPNHDAIIECLPTCTSRENPPKYPAMTCSKFLISRFKKFTADFEGENNTKA